MREFLLCMLICCLSHLAFGQDTLTSYASPPLSEYEIWKLEQERMDKEVFGRIVWAWEMYEAECWADSTKVSGWRTHISETKIMGFSSVYETYDTWTEHRDPTFLGFMEFLKRKVKP